ncbi:hypothetical protein ACWGFX_01205 [Streptomyces xanthophaeus]
MSSRPDLHPARLSVHDDGPFAHRPELLEEELFWWAHLSACLRGTPRSWLGPYDPIASRAFGRRLWTADDRPVFTVPVAGGLRLHVVYENADEVVGVHYAVHHPDWEEAELLARDDGHWRGPGLSWPELVGVADNGLPGGTTTDPDTRLLLLLPALGDTDLPAGAAQRLAACLRDRLGAREPGRLAVALLRRQGVAGPAGWRTGPHGVRVNDGKQSFRNPADRAALPDCRLAQVSAALDPEPGRTARAGARLGPGHRPGECRPDDCRAVPRSTAGCPRRVAYAAWVDSLMSGTPPF